jgi:hypothetical protein
MVKRRKMFIEFLQRMKIMLRRAFTLENVLVGRRGHSCFLFVPKSFFLLIPKDFSEFIFFMFLENKHRKT